MTEEKITAEEFIGMIIDREFTKRPFTVKDVIKRISSLVGPEISRFSHTVTTTDGLRVTLDSEFDDYMRLAVSILSKERDEAGHRLFIHLPLPEGSVVGFDDEDGHYFIDTDNDDWKKWIWFHRDIATPPELRAFGEWLRDAGERETT
jgi:hypothetical protein